MKERGVQGAALGVVVLHAHAQALAPHHPAAGIGEVEPAPRPAQKHHRKFQSLGAVHRKDAHTLPAAHRAGAAQVAPGAQRVVEIGQKTRQAAGGHRLVSARAGKKGVDQSSPSMM